MFEIITTILVLVGVCVLAFYATRLIAKSYNLHSSGNNIQLRDRVMLSVDKYLVVVSVADKTLLLSVTKDRIEMLSELDANMLSAPPSDANNTDFASIFASKFKNTALSKLGLKKEPEDK